MKLGQRVQLIDEDHAQGTVSICELSGTHEWRLPATDAEMVFVVFDNPHNLRELLPQWVEVERLQALDK
jgi:hypothetical protein